MNTYELAEELEARLNPLNTEEEAKVFYYAAQMLRRQEQQIRALYHAAETKKEPVKRKWIALTLNDISGAMCDCADDDGHYQFSCFIDFAKEIENKVKELNQ